MNQTENKIECDETECFFKAEEGEEHHHVCHHCTRNKQAVRIEEDYKTIFQRNGY